MIAFPAGVRVWIAGGVSVSDTLAHCRAHIRIGICEGPTRFDRGRKVFNTFRMGFGQSELVLARFEKLGLFGQHTDFSQ